MFELPREKKVRVPLAVGITFIALGFFFFESLGAFVGHYSEEIRQWEAAEIEAHPEAVSVQDDGYPLYSTDQAATIGLKRLLFFHGHGYNMVLASLAFILLLAFAPGMKPNLKGILMWISMGAMLMYNIGWGFAGLMLPYLGAQRSQMFAEWFFFIPFGLTVFAVTGILAFTYGIQAVTVIRSIERD